MKKSLAQKIIEAHAVEGRWIPGEEIAVRIDQTLTQDATGTVAYLEFETLGLDSVKTELSASYVDHNLLQTDFKNADDHNFLYTTALRYGLYFSPPGNGVSHPVHLERFGVPGKTLLGSDSHTSTAGALGMVGVGAGGLDVALAMAGEPFHMEVPRILGVRLTGRLKGWVSAKDVILEMLRRHTVKGGVGRIVEYYGPGVKTIPVPGRATIANMGAELGATTTVFPSDERTREYMRRNYRAAHWLPLQADRGAGYDEHDEIDLSKLEPMIACPSSPDNVVRVGEVEGEPISQAIIGSSVNSSYRDMMVAALAIKGRNVAPGVSFEINPGSRTVLESVERAGGTLMLNHAGARIHQSGCLGCIGMGQAPPTNGASVRTFPRNFPGRSGTEGDRVYLASPETAVASAIFGRITDPGKLGKAPRPAEPLRYRYNKSTIIAPLPVKERKKVVISRGANIKPFPSFGSMPERVEGEVLLKLPDNISTDSIMPAGNDVLPLRSNIPAVSEHFLERIEKGFAARCRASDGGMIVAGENYGQGSSREHAAIAPRYLGIRVKIAKSFARIHRANLINFGIAPLTFRNKADYGRIRRGDRLVISALRDAVRDGSKTVEAVRESDGRKMALEINLSERERQSVVDGGTLNMWKRRHVKNKK